MLVLSRQRDQTIMIGDGIEITVVDLRGDKVRLGITAPKEISVHRKEVYDAIQRENRAAAKVKADDLAKLDRERDRLDAEENQRRAQPATTKPDAYVAGKGKLA